MADTLSRIVGPVNMANGTSTVFTGTGGHIYSIRSIILANSSGGSVTVKLGIGGVADANLILADTAVADNSTVTVESLIIMAGTETLQANTTATGCAITVCGLDQS